MADASDLAGHDDSGCVWSRQRGQRRDLVQGYA